MVLRIFSRHTEPHPETAPPQNDGKPEVDIWDAGRIRHTPPEKLAEAIEKWIEGLNEEGDAPLPPTAG